MALPEPDGLDVLSLNALRDLVVSLIGQTNNREEGVDRIDAMRLFVRVVERRSFTLAAQDIGIPRSSATQVVKQLEDRLGVRLLQRTTRVVTPTLDGQAYARRCLAILAEIENAEGVFSGARPKGVLRIEVQGTIARHFLLTGLPDFLRAYPDLEIAMSEGECWVDVVREGIDCVLRYGQLADSDLIARRVAVLERLTCAAPAYLKRFGHPTGIDDLEGHRMVALRSLTTGQLTPLQFAVDGGYRTVMLPAPVAVTGTESYLATALLGLGLLQILRFHAGRHLAAGALVEILEDNRPPSMPVSLLYPHSRQLSPRVRVFLRLGRGAVRGGWRLMGRHQTARNARFAVFPASKRVNGFRPEPTGALAPLPAAWMEEQATLRG